MNAEGVAYFFRFFPHADHVTPSAFDAHGSRIFYNHRTPSGLKNHRLRNMSYLLLKERLCFLCVRTQSEPCSLR